MTSPKSKEQVVLRLDLIEEAVKEQWGDRCPDFNADCACCQAWMTFDALSALPTPPKGGEE